MFDREMRYLALSRRWKEDYGLGDVEVRGKSHYEVFPEIGEKWKAIHRRGLEGEVIRADEDAFVRADGSVQWLRWEVRPWLRDDGTVGGVLIFSEDISPYKRAEEGQRRLADLLRVIRRVNFLITREKDRSSLLRQCCELLTETRGYRSAWIGLLGKDGRMRLAGFSGLGPDPRLLESRFEREELPHCCREALDHPDHVIRQDTRAECADCVLAGDRREDSVFAGALRHAGRNYAVLVVSALPGMAMDGEEESLFREILDDLGFALYAIEGEEDRAASAEALRASEARLRATFEQAAVGLAELGLDGRWLRVNERLCAILGQSPELLLGLSLADVAEGEDLARDRRSMDGLLRGELATSTLENRLLRRDSTSVAVNLTLSLRRDEEGEPACFIVVVEDITDRKRAEAEVLASRSKLEAALESMTDAVFISDAEGRFIDFNEAFASFHRFKDKSECATTFAEYPAFLDVYQADGQLAPVSQWAVPRALRGEVGTNVEYGLRRKDTGQTWVGSYSFAPIRDKDGRIVGSVVVGRDVTEEKSAQAALRESELRFSKSFHANPAAIAISRLRDGLYVDVNEAFERLFGYGKAEVIGSSADRLGLWPKTLREPLVKEISQRGRIENFELTIRRKSGEACDLLASFEAIELGGDPCILSILTDITDMKRAEAAVASALREKESLLRELYHRTKNNMLTIISMLSLRAAMNPQIALRDFVEDMSQRVMAMALIHDKLYKYRDLSRIDLGEYIADLAALRMGGTELGARVELVIEAEKVLVLIDTAMPLALVANELLTNALKHAFPGERRGRIALGLRRKATGEIELSVSDDGIGLPSEPGGEASRGFGLRMTFAIVEQQLQGRIELSGEGGTSYRIRFRDDLYEKRV
jgi:PAS domain S-box-containing protein